MDRFRKRRANCRDADLFGSAETVLRQCGFTLNCLTDEGEDLVRAALGANYQRLVELKTKYDPERLQPQPQSATAALKLRALERRVGALWGLRVTRASKRPCNRAGSDLRVVAQNRWWLWIRRED